MQDHSSILTVLANDSTEIDTLLDELFKQFETYNIEQLEPKLQTLNILMNILSSLNNLDSKYQFVDELQNMGAK
jgi:hypothetical protein